MKKYGLIAIMLIAVMMLVGCSHNAEVSKNADENETVSFSASKTENNDSKIVTEIESSTEVSTSQTTTAQSTTKPKETERNTTVKTTTAKPKTTTTQRQTATKKQTTTKKVTTTQKPATTKKVTTTKFEWDCNVDGHTSSAGQIGWVNSYEEAVKKARAYGDQNADSSGYRIEQCHMCGKYTAYITLD